MTFTWDHLHLKSLDPEATAEFYKTMFGAEDRGRMDTGQLFRVTVALAGIPLFIDRVSADIAPTPEPPFQGLEHIGLTVQKIDEVVADLKSRGAEIVVEPYDVRPGTRIAFVRGPDNVRIELLQRS